MLITWLHEPGVRLGRLQELDLRLVVARLAIMSTSACTMLTLLPSSAPPVSLHVRIRRRRHAVAQAEQPIVAAHQILLGRIDQPDPADDVHGVRDAVGGNRGDGAVLADRDRRCWVAP